MDRIVAAQENIDETAPFESVRPTRLADFVGQHGLKENLKVFIKSAKDRGAAMDHCLLYGPPGLGKTTLAGIIASELSAGFRATSAPMFTKVGDLAAIFTSLAPGDVLFIDEIHRLGAAIEEALYSIMEDFKLDIVIGEGPAARTVKIDVAPFTLVGATTRTGLLSTALRERFGIPLAFEFYKDEELAEIVVRSGKILDIALSEAGAREIAKRSRGTPRIANRLLKRVRDFAVVEGRKSIDEAEAKTSLFKLQVDERGLDALDRRYLSLVIENYDGGPVGIETLSALLSEEIDTIEDVIEPYLLQIGFLQKTPRGRVVTDKARGHLGAKRAAK
jgi:Holliday junction DNA helicase RuvB